MHLALNTLTFNRVVTNNVASDSKPVEFSGGIHVELVTPPNGQTTMQVSGLHENVLGSSIEVVIFPHNQNN
jgi:hypothetical protein